MAEDDGGITIIKKKKKVVGGGHHGGAWKVAYADFVTAMMAFFLLMWLLNATTEKQRKGLADYFTPTIPIHSSSGGGNGVFDGQTIAAQNQLVAQGRGAESRQPSAQKADKGETGFNGEDSAKGEADAAARETVTLSEYDDEMNRLEGMLIARSGESEFDDDEMQHVRTRITDEGLVIEIFDLPNAPLFDGFSDTPTPFMDKIVGTVADVIGQVSNEIALVGHSYAGGGSGDSAADWYLSANRAQTARRLLIGNGVNPRRLQRVTGKADRAPGFDDIKDSRNNRIEVILLR